MERKRRCLLAVLTLLGAAFVTGCSSVQRESEQGREEPLVLEVYAWPDEEENVQLLSDAYTKEHPEVEIHANIIPMTEFRQKMLSLKNGEQRADCVFGAQLAEAVLWKEKGLLKNLDKYLDGLEMEEHYEQWYAEGEEACASYMMPYRKSRWVVYYNKDLFDKMGVDYPREGWTWQDYEEIAQELSGSLGGERIYGSLSFEPNSIWWRVPARTRGANDPFSKADLQAFREAAQWNYNLTYNLKVQMPYYEQEGGGFDYEGTFLEGKTGMYFCGDWSLATLNRRMKEADSPFSFDIAPLPSWEGEESYVISDAAVISMMECTEHPDEAFEFMRFVSGEDGAAVLANNNVLPAWNSDKVQNIYRKAAGTPEHVEYFFTKGKISRVPASCRYSEGIEIVRDEVAKYLLQEQDLEQTYQNIERKLNDL